MFPVAIQGTTVKIQKKEKENKNEFFLIRQRNNNKGSAHSLLGSHWDHAFGADAHWDVVEQRLRKLLLYRLDIPLVQVGPQQAHTAVDVEADAP